MKNTQMCQNTFDEKQRGKDSLLPDVSTFWNANNVMVKCASNGSSIMLLELWCGIIFLLLCMRENQSALWGCSVWPKSGIYTFLCIWLNFCWWWYGTYKGQKALWQSIGKVIDVLKEYKYLLHSSLFLCYWVSAIFFIIVAQMKEGWDIRVVFLIVKCL